MAQTIMWSYKPVVRNLSRLQPRVTHFRSEVGRWAGAKTEPLLSVFPVMAEGGPAAGGTSGTEWI